MEALVINDSITLPARELRVQASRSSGPGGQNVNKVASKIELEFHVAATTVLDAWTKQRLLTIAGRRVDGEGWLHIVSQATRDQQKNLEDARQKLAAMIREALVRPKIRRPTKPTRGSKERRLTEKKQTSQRKQNRRSYDD